MSHDKLGLPVRRFSLRPAQAASPPQVGALMAAVLAALTPGVAALVWQFGPGVLLQCGLATLTALLAEAVAVKLRGRPALPALRDGSAIVTAVLLAVSIPGMAPWWIIVIGAAFAILIGKQVYGGLGSNPFNPAMVAYAVLLIAFPREMTLWPAPLDARPESQPLADAFRAVLDGWPAARLDALAMATPLDATRTLLGQGKTVDAAHAGMLAAINGMAAVNLGFLLGGLWMLRRQVIDWRIPSGVLGGLFAAALVGYLGDSRLHPTPLFHLFSGATMLAAFFIATDPVSAATTPRGRWLYGSGIGLLIYLIRTWGGYPDGVAFATLLMNLAAPTLDHFSRPRAYGHPR